MKFLKKHWYLVLVTLFTIGLGVMVYLTSQQLSTTSQVAPNVPEAEPQAAAAACTLAFALNTTGTTPTPTPVPPTPTPTPVPPTATPTPVQQIVYVNPTATPTPVQTVTTVDVTETPGPTPKTPVSGGPTILGVSVVSVGLLILILGLAL